MKDLIVGVVYVSICYYMFSGLYKRVPLPNKIKMLLVLYIVIHYARNAWSDA